MKIKASIQILIIEKKKIKLDYEKMTNKAKHFLYNDITHQNHITKIFNG